MARRMSLDIGIWKAAEWPTEDEALATFEDLQAGRMPRIDESPELVRFAREVMVAIPGLEWTASEVVVLVPGFVGTIDIRGGYALVSLAWDKVERAGPELQSIARTHGFTICVPDARSFGSSVIDPDWRSIEAGAQREIRAAWRIGHGR